MKGVSHLLLFNKSPQNLESENSRQFLLLPVSVGQRSGGRSEGVLSRTRAPKAEATGFVER